MCTRPMPAYIDPDGGRPIFGWEGQKRGLREIHLPCGKCPECQHDYYKQWATRGSRELSQWDSSLFITLTYNDEHLPKDKSLDKKHIQDFIKRVKKYANSTESNPVRQIYTGEYGTQTFRPHYHAVLFNLDFPDRKFHRKSEDGNQIYTSETLTKLWGKGFAEFGNAQAGSIAYIFKYILKKKTRKEKSQPLIIEVDGVTYEVCHEFVESSRNPGIGAFMRDSQSLKKGYLSVNGVRSKLPKYYSEFLRITEPDLHEKLLSERFDYVSKLPKENPLRRAQKELAQKRLTDTKKKL